MNIVQQFRRILTAFLLVCILTTTVACSSSVQAKQPTDTVPGINRGYYSALERGNTSTGQNFGDWVVQTSQGMIKDAYVRDNNKLGVVISREVRPNDVRPLAKSLAQGFHRNFPNQDVSIFMYAPDKKLILTANYDVQTNQVQYK